jgi:AcrR family transcriptional regulator
MPPRRPRSSARSSPGARPSEAPSTPAEGLSTLVEAPVRAPAEAPEPLARVLFDGGRLEAPVIEEDNPTRRKLLAAAMEAFAEQGFRGAATRVIAARAGVAEKTLFAHYGSKAALFAAAMGPGLDAMMGAGAVAELTGVLACGGTIEERLYAVARNRIEFAGKNLHLVKAFIQELLLDPEFRERLRERFVQRLLPAARMAIAHGVAAGRLRPVEPERVIRMLISLVAGYIVTRYIVLPERAWDDEAELRLMIDTLVRGLAPDR